MSRNNAVTTDKAEVPSTMPLSRSMSRLLGRAMRGTKVLANPTPSLTSAATKKEFKTEQAIRRVEEILFNNEDNDPHWCFIHRQFSGQPTNLVLEKESEAYCEDKNQNKQCIGAPEAAITVDVSPSLSLHERFSAAEVRAWDPEGFEIIQKLQDAARNQGEVLLVEEILFKNEDIDPQWMFIHRQFSNQTVDLSPSLSLHEQFDMACIRAWDPNGFEFIQKLQDAVRNQGEVLLMRERSSNAQVAVKRMPTTRVGSSNEDFRVRHPDDCENPWQDIGCMRYLNSIGYPYTCQLLGVFYDKQHAYVVSSFATQGDLHTWCSLGPKPSLESEVHKQPVCVEILRAMKQLHDSSVVHGDVSLENICLSQPTPFCNDGKDDGNKGVKITLQVKVIDFGVASACRQLKYSGGGKHRYHAPEVHSGENYDGFLSDAFSIGVVLYAVMTMDYPWL
eukprot:CAMPEP_0172787074 /NCGR_PEP_ID=MMETSP1074-20121228/206269_1 /TAXON_ID=2916 /ORGANISM="Ceratium fusus, Strain PA161109" /LENGTH=447 /DNA_ID=CAMNT_0013624095 /DNA_START=45 /DNA_END=1384 /DNA_ORIENTATION=-